MTRRPHVYIEGRCYRRRRGRLVAIPEQWVGETLHPQTKRKRPSKGPRKARMRKSPRGNALTQYGGKPGHPWRWAPRHTSGSREHSEQLDIRGEAMPNVDWRVPLAEVRTADHAEYEARCRPCYTPCLLCGKPIDQPWPHVVQLVDGGATILAEDAIVDVTDPGYVGCWPVGESCYRRLLRAIEVS